MFAAAGPGLCIWLGSPGLDLETMVLSQELTEDSAPLCMTLVPIFAMALMGEGLQLWLQSSNIFSEGLGWIKSSSAQGLHLSLEIALMMLRGPSTQGLLLSLRLEAALCSAQGIMCCWGSNQPGPHARWPYTISKLERCYLSDPLHICRCGAWTPLAAAQR